MSKPSQPATPISRSTPGELTVPPHVGEPDGHGHGEVNHETLDAPARPLVIAGFALIAVMLAAMAFIWVFYFAFDQGELPVNMRPLPTVEAERLPPGPLLRANPAQDTSVIVTQQREILESYGERDGVVHIPIERAMDLIVERGVGAATPEATPTP